MNKERIKEAIVSQKKVFLEKRDLFQRDILQGFYHKFHKNSEILVITGVRRCGKSSLMRLLWDEYAHHEKLTKEQFLYLNFEDERLTEFDKDDFSKLLEAYLELYTPDKKKKLFLFLDEIQNVSHWEKWLNRLYAEDKYRIFVTGSNATLLSSELATSLTGRNIPITLHPLSFREYLLHFKGQELTAESFYQLEEKIKIEKTFNEYLLFGGMPAFIKTRSIELIQEYFKDIISCDIVNRYRVKYKQELKELAHLLLSNLGQIQSLKNISRGLELKNINTIKNYLGYLENSFLFQHLPLFSYSLKKQIYNPDKYYTVDIAFFQNIAFKNSANAGAVYENIVFAQLGRNSQNEIFYFKTKKGFEVDFVVKRKNEIQQLIQVCLDPMNVKTVEREERALWDAMAELNIKKGFILNGEIEKTEKRAGKSIQYVLLWKWLLEK